MTVVVVVTSDSDACDACWFRSETKQILGARARDGHGPRRLPPPGAGRARALAAGVRIHYIDNMYVCMYVCNVM